MTFDDIKAVHVRKTRGSQRRSEIFGFLQVHGRVAGALRRATLFDSYESAEIAAASFVMMNPVYTGRAEVRSVKGNHAGPVVR